MNELVSAATEIATQAGRLLKDAHHRGDAAISSKSTVIDLVTDADRESEAYILGAIHARFPDHAVVAEESGHGRRDGAYRWVVDPLDGTVNFAHGLPHFAVLIGVQAWKGGAFETVVGVTYDPMLAELFVAVEGGHATLNGARLRTSGTTRLIDAVGATGFMYDRLSRGDDNHREFCRLNLLTQGVRRTGSAGLDLAYVACGRFDFFWESTLRLWDLVGGALMIREAGGVITNVDGRPHDPDRGTALAANPTLHPMVLAALASAAAHPTGSRDGLEAFLPPELAKGLFRG
ncbi:MAG: inositol monophosphatase [Deltaproteobacteria bacterium]|nr:inositol monophosphatase [Deltaproteobacteria bacterium]